MIIYISIFGLLVFLRLAFRQNVNLLNALYPILLFLLFLFSAFRFEVGCDWPGYLSQFEIQRFSTLSDALQRMDPLWWATLEVVHWLDLPYPWVNVASSAIFFSGVHILARRQPDPLGFLVLLFPILIIGMPMSGIRQGAAIGIMCIAFAAFQDKRLVSFVAWTVVGSALHSSAIVFLLLAPLVWGKYTKKRLAIAFLLAIPGALILSTGEAAEQATSRYVGTGIEAVGAIFRVGLLVMTGVVYFVLFQRKWASVFPKDYKLMSVGALLMVSTAVPLAFSTVIADRIGYYLIPIQAMMFARIPYLQIRDNGSFYAAAPYLVFAVVFIIWTWTSWHFEVCYAPYRNWLLGFPKDIEYWF